MGVDLGFVKGKGLPQNGYLSKDPKTANMQGKSFGLPNYLDSATKIGGINKPVIGSDFATPKGVENTQISNFPTAVKQQIKQETMPTQAQPQQQTTQQWQQELGQKAVIGKPVSAQSDPSEFTFKEKAFMKQAKDQGYGLEDTLGFINQNRQGGVEQPTEGGIGTQLTKTNFTDLGATGESLINPVGKIAGVLDKQIQKIGSFDLAAGPEAALNKRIANLTPEEIQDYREQFNKFKTENPVLSRLYKVPEGDNVVSRIRHAIKGEYKDVGDEKELQGYIYEQEKNLLDHLVGAGESGPRIPNMLANIPGSAVKVTGLMANAVLNPIDTLASLGEMILTKEGRAGLSEFVSGRYGSWEAFAKSLEQDPVGVASDALIAIDMGAGVVKAAATTTAKVAAKAGAYGVAQGARGVANVAGQVSKVAGGMGTLGMSEVLPKGLQMLKNATKVGETATPGMKVASKAVDYAVSMTKPVETAREVIGRGVVKFRPNIQGNETAKKVATAFVGNTVKNELIKEGKPFTQDNVYSKMAEIYQRRGGKINPPKGYSATEIDPMGMGLPGEVGQVTGKATQSQRDGKKTWSEAQKETPTAADNMVQRTNRMTKGDQAKFYKENGMSVGKYINDTVGPQTPQDTVQKMGERVSNNMKKVDEAVEMVKEPVKFEAVPYTDKNGDTITYPGDAILDMAIEAVDYAARTNDGRVKILDGILKRYEAGTMSASDLNKLQRYYQKTMRMSYFKDMTAGDKTQRSTNIDSAVREYKFKLLEDNGFTNFREINRDTKAAMTIMKNLSKEEAGKIGNNAVSITDWFLIGHTLVNPALLTAVVGKKLISSNRFAKKTAQVLNIINGHKLQEEKLADLDSIAKIQSEKELQRWIQAREKAYRDFLNKGSTKGKGLPEDPKMKGVKTYIPAGETITVTPTGQAKTKKGLLEIGTAKEPGTTKQVNIVPETKSIIAETPKVVQETPTEAVKTDSKGLPMVGTQKEVVKQIIEKKERPMGIKEVADESGIKEANIRRILGQGEKIGEFIRVGKGVYTVETPEGTKAVIHMGDSLETVQKMVKDGVKVDMIFMDIPYDTPAVKGGNRGVKYDLISHDYFNKLMGEIKQLVKKSSTPLYHMYSQAPSGWQAMKKYNDIIEQHGFKPVAFGGRQKTFKDGSPVTNVRGEVSKPEGIALYTLDGVFDDKAIRKLDFVLVRPKGKTEKPVEMLASLINQGTNKGDLVLDPFAGAGPTVEAALQEGRNVIAIEKSPEQAKKILDRTAKYEDIGTEKEITDQEWKELTNEQPEPVAEKKQLIERKQYTIDDLKKNNQINIDNAKSDIALLEVKLNTVLDEIKAIRDNKDLNQIEQNQEMSRFGLTTQRDKLVNDIKRAERNTKKTDPDTIVSEFDREVKRAEKEYYKSNSMSFGGGKDYQINDGQLEQNSFGMNKASKIMLGVVGVPAVEAIQLGEEYRAFWEDSMRKRRAAERPTDKFKGMAKEEIIQLPEFKDLLDGYWNVMKDTAKEIAAKGKITGFSNENDYNTAKADLVSNPKQDGIQTNEGGTVGLSNEVVKLPTTTKESGTESRTEAEDTGIQQGGQYTSDVVSAGDGSGAGQGTLTKGKQGELNKEVIKILNDKQFSKNPKDYTEEEIKKMLQYEGGGGLSKGEGDTSGSNDEFYTPTKIIDDMRYLAKKYGFSDGAVVFEPAAGTGRFIRQKPMRTGAAVGYEIDKVSGTIAQITNPDASIKIGDFQDQFMDFSGTRPLSEKEVNELPKADIVIGNPPYKLRDTVQRRRGEQSGVNRFEEYFLMRGLDKVVDGGVMVMIVPSAFMDKGRTIAKTYLGTNATLVDAYRLPNKAFPNTDVGTDIVVFQKRVGSQADQMDQFNITSDGKRFKDHPEKVFGEVAERTNRFGKLENYTKGTMEDIKIRDEVTEKYGPLTLTNMVTGKKEIMDTPEAKLPEAPKQKGIIQILPQRGNSPKAKMTNAIMEITGSDMKKLGDDGYIKLESDGYMPLHVQMVGYKKLAVSHTYIQNGDVMNDPEVIFNINEDGSLSAETIQNDPYPAHSISPNDPFLELWADNLRDQGFISEQGIKAPEVFENPEKVSYKITKNVYDQDVVIKETVAGGIKVTREINEFNKEENAAATEYLNKEKGLKPVGEVSKKEPTNKGLQEFTGEKNTQAQAISKAKSLGGTPTKDPTTPKERAKTVDKIFEEAKLDPEGTETRIFNRDTVDAKHIDDILHYQSLTNTLDEVQGVNYTENPAILNYMDGHTFLNYNYFSGDVYAKLDQLELDKDMIDPEQYMKQKQGLLDIMPKPQELNSIAFNPLDDELMALESNEIHTVNKWVYDEATKRSNMVESTVPMTIKDLFSKWLREEGVGRRAVVSSHDIINYFNKGKVDADRAGEIMTKAHSLFNKFMKDELDPDVQDRILTNHNRRERSLVPLQTEQIPMVIKGIAKNFRAKPLVIKDLQVRHFTKAALKGNFYSAAGVGYGKTMIGILAIEWGLQNGKVKRPVITVPVQTQKGRMLTYSAMFPSRKINFLSTLDSKRREKMIKERGNDVSKWIEDGTVTIIGHTAIDNQMSFKDKTLEEILGQFKDDMASLTKTDKQTAAEDEKTEAITLNAGKAKVKAQADFSMYDGEWLKEQYANMQSMGHDEFVKNFIDTDITENKITPTKAEVMRDLRPIYFEDFGFDSITVDEAHKYKNIFGQAVIEEGKNMYGKMKGSTSIRGTKMAVISSYIQARNNGRGFVGLTATPINNQSIELYNMMSLVARPRLKRMGLTNMNTFMTRYADIKEYLVIKQTGKFAYEQIQKGFANVGDLQNLMAEYIEYTGDDPDIIKPELVHKQLVLQWSDEQKMVQEQIEARIDAGKEKGDKLGGGMEAIQNSVSPYFTQYASTQMPTVERFMADSPKLNMFAKIVKMAKEEGIQGGTTIFAPEGVKFHELLREGISKETGIPINRIGIINGEGKFKKNMFKTIDQYNAGELDVLIGGDTINEGIDLLNTYMLYDSSLPRNPTTWIQRPGRGWRQGNLRNIVNYTVALMENSIDSFKLQKLEEKQGRINNIFSAQGDVFSTEDGSVDTEGQKIAIITDPKKKALIEIGMESKRLERSMSVTEGDINDLERHRANLKAEIEQVPELIKAMDRGYGGESYVKDIKKQIASLQGKADRSRAFLEKNNMNIDAEIESKKRELESLAQEKKGLEDSLDFRIKKFEIEKADIESKRVSEEEYIEDMRKLFKKIKIFGTQEEQAMFKTEVKEKKKQGLPIFEE